MNDVVIQGGQVIDGTGAARQIADVAINNGYVTDIGTNLPAGEYTIDASGKIVAPGFVDVHTHYDVMCFWDSFLTPSPQHGVTSVFGGNCGFSVAPLTDDSADYLVRMLATVEAMPLDALQQGVDWKWRSTAEYLARLDGNLAINAGFMVGHSAIRCAIMGDAAIEREATPVEIDQMAELLREGLTAGGIGFSSTWSSSHVDAEGKPVPSRLAGARELVALAKVCGEFEGTSLEFLPGHPRVPWSQEIQDVMINMTVAAKRPLNWNAISGSHSLIDHWEDKLALGDRARSEGGKIVGLVLPQDFGSRFNFRTAFVLSAIQGWADAMDLPLPQRLAVLKDPVERARLREAAAGDTDMGEFINWAAKEIVETFNENLKHYEGRDVSDIAAEEGKDPFDALLDIVVADDLRTSFSNSRNSANSQEDWQARANLWRDPRVVVGGSDAGAHLDMLHSFSLTTQFLAHARDHGLLSTEEAVRLLTSVPADLYGVRDRGRLLQGSHADVVVFDEDSVRPDKVVTRYDLPGGHGRLYAEAIGIDHVLVNGQPVVTDGKLTANRPGVVIKSGRDTVTPSLV